MWLYHFARFLLWLPLRLIYPRKIYGSTKLPKKKRAIVASNHYSAADAFFHGSIFNIPVHFMGKKELWCNWLLRWILDTLQAIPVDRDGKDFRAIKDTMKYLKQDKPVALFPEGTRNKDPKGDVMPFKSGAVMFAAKTRSPIYPCIFLEKPRAFRMNYLIVGEPIVVFPEEDVRMSAEEIEERTKLLEESMRNLHNDLRAKVAARKNKK